MSASLADPRDLSSAPRRAMLPRGLPGAAGRSALTFQWSARDLGILPLIVAMPFLYFPQALASDSQPWIFIGTLIALFTFRIDHSVYSRDLALIGLTLVCAAVSALRSDVDVDLARSTFNFVGLIVTWLVVRRAGNDYLASGVRLTIVLWFIVGFLEYLSVRLGTPVVPFGRFVASYSSGVPGLASESSFYGSMSILQVLYLLGQGDRRNRVYIVLGCLSVLFSGSALSILMLGFPFLRLPTRMKVWVIFAGAALLVVSSALAVAGQASRFDSIINPGGGAGGLIDLLIDPSVNLRIGAVWFTFIDNFWNSMLLSGRVHFMADYNQFATRIGLLIPTESNLILPTGGELIYRCGPLGVALLVALAAEATAKGRSLSRKAQRLAVFVACIINPVAISNIFFIAYLQGDDRD